MQNHKKTSHPIPHPEIQRGIKRVCDKHLNLTLTNTQLCAPINVQIIWDNLFFGSP